MEENLEKNEPIIGKNLEILEVAKTILENERCYDVRPKCLSIKEILANTIFDVKSVFQDAYIETIE